MDPKTGFKASKMTVLIPDQLGFVSHKGLTLFKHQRDGYNAPRQIYILGSFVSFSRHHCLK
jgi:hypothetical protein